MNLLRSKKDQIELVALMLLETKHLQYLGDIATLIRERPFEGDTAYEEFIQ